jgi:hypothetical protein
MSSLVTKPISWGRCRNIELIVWPCLFLSNNEASELPDHGHMRVMFGYKMHRTSWVKESLVRSGNITSIMAHKLVSFCFISKFWFAFCKAFLPFRHLLPLWYSMSSLCCLCLQEKRWYGSPETLLTGTYFRKHRISVCHHVMHYMNFKLRECRHILVEM